MRERGICEPLVFDPKDKASMSMTRQSFAKEADINTIMGRYAVSGVLVDPLNVDSSRVARFGDFSDITDYSHLVGRIQQAQADFMTLPSVVRAKFDNDVEKALEFITVPENVFEAVKLGLVPETMLEATFLVRPDLRPEPAKDFSTVTPVTPAS
ncbi:MAG: internal scaffolding protein [Arizlama microvirus]|nr:MAG: internal scaffolding protein [Arizlama microvirus]